LQGKRKKKKKKKGGEKMKFNKKLLTTMVPEWKKKYIQYDKLKKQISQIKDEIFDIAKENGKKKKGKTRWWSKMLLFFLFFPFVAQFVVFFLSFPLPTDSLLEPVKKIYVSELRGEKVFK
jgi:hypothetical protein